MGAIALRSLPIGFKIGLTFLVVTLLGGMAASFQHLFWHHESRDDRAGLSVVDIEGAYHGVEAPAPMLIAMRRNHPPELDPGLREALVSWLESGDLSRDYDNFDLGERAPAEIIAGNCVSCHSRGSSDESAKAIPLEFWDDVNRVSHGRNIQATDVKILAASTHTHAISLGMLGIVSGGLLLLTSFPRIVTGTVTALLGVSLALDIAAWWLARESAGFVMVIIGAGWLFNGLTVLALLAVLVDCWLPRRRGA